MLVLVDVSHAFGKRVNHQKLDAVLGACRTRQSHVLGQIDRFVAYIGIGVIERYEAMDSPHVRSGRHEAAADLIPVVLGEDEANVYRILQKASAGSPGGPSRQFNGHCALARFPVAREQGHAAGEGKPFVQHAYGLRPDTVHRYRVNVSGHGSPPNPLNGVKTARNGSFQRFSGVKNGAKNANTAINGLFRHSQRLVICHHSFFVCFVFSWATTI